MTQDLFRSEAAEYKNSRYYGATRASFPSASALILLGVAALFSGLIFFLCFGSFTKKVFASGVISSSAGSIFVTAPGTGAISSVLVSEDTDVLVQQVLASIHSGLSLSDGRSTEGLNLGQIDAAIEELEEIIQINEREWAAERRMLEQELKDRKLQTSSLGLQSKYVNEQISNSSERVDAANTLAAAGYLSGNELSNRRQELISLKREAEELRLRHIENRTAIQSAAERLTIAQLRRDKEISEKWLQIADLRRQRLSFNEKSDLAVIASAAGKVISVKPFPGQRVEAGEVLFAIRPSGSTLTAEINVPSSKMGEVKVGQMVHMKLRPYPYQKFGVAEGVIVRISGTTTSRSTSPRDSSAEPLFRAIVPINIAAMTNKNKDVVLREGMEIDVEIAVGTQPIGEYLLQKIF